MGGARVLLLLDFICWPAVRRVGAGGAFGPAPPTHMSVQVRSLGTRNLPGDGSWRFGDR